MPELLIELGEAWWSEVLVGVTVWLLTVLPRHVRRKLLRQKVEAAYLKLRLVCEPRTLNPDAPGNPVYMASDARDTVNVLRKRLLRAGYAPPDKCSSNNESLKEWFSFLSDVRDDL